MSHLPDVDFSIFIVIINFHETSFQFFKHILCHLENVRQYFWTSDSSYLSESHTCKFSSEFTEAMNSFRNAFNSSPSMKPLPATERQHCPISSPPVTSHRVTGAVNEILLLFAQHSEKDPTRASSFWKVPAIKKSNYNWMVWLAKILCPTVGIPLCFCLLSEKNCEHLTKFR